MTIRLYYQKSEVNLFKKLFFIKYPLKRSYYNFVFSFGKLNKASLGIKGAGGVKKKNVDR